MRASTLSSLLMLVAVSATVMASFPACALEVSCAGSDACVSMRAPVSSGSVAVAEATVACCSGPEIGEASPAVGAKPDHGVSGLVALVSQVPLVTPAAESIARLDGEDALSGTESPPLYTLHSALLR